MKKLLISLTAVAFLVTSFSSVWAFDQDISNTAHGVVTTEYSFLYDGNTYTGTASQYISDSLYNVLYNEMTSETYLDSISDFGAHKEWSYNIINYTIEQATKLPFATSMTLFENMLGNKLWYNTAEIYAYDFENGLTQINSPSAYPVGDVFSWFNILDFPDRTTQPKFSAYTVPLGTSVGASYYTANTIYDYGNFRGTAGGWDATYKRMFPFYTALSHNDTSQIYYIFPVYPTTALSDGHFDFTGLKTYVYDGNEYVFVPVIQLFAINPGGQNSFARVNAVCYSLTLTEFTNYMTQAGLYNYYTTGSFDYTDSGGNAETDYTRLLQAILANQEIIIENQETHTSLFQTIIQKLDALITSFTNNNTISNEEQETIDNADNLSSDLTDTSEDITGIEDTYSDDFDLNLQNANDDLSIDDTLSENQNGITWFSSTLQSFYAFSDGLAPVFTLPLVYGFLRLFLGV